MDVFTLVLFIVAAVVLSSFLSRFIPKVSTPLVQIALGVLIALTPSFPHVTLDPELFIVLFIAPLLYLEAHEIDKSALLKTLTLSLSLAIGLAIATMAAVGFVLHSIWPAVSLAAALALGAALGPTDAVAVSSLGKDAALTQRQKSVLQGESLFNDASGIIGFQFAIAAALTGEFEVGQAAGRFILSFIGGAAFGLLVGMLANLLFESLRALGWESTTTRILMELFLPFMLYMGAEALGVSGILAVVTAGLFIRFDRNAVGPNVARTNIVASSVWTVLSFTLNGIVFILLGMLLPNAMSASWDDPHVSNLQLLATIAVIAFVVIAMRFVWTSGMLRIARDQTTHLRRKMTADRWRSAAIMTFGGAKGTITLSLMFTIPYTLADGAQFPMRDELIFIAGGVIIITLLLANFLLPLIAPNRSAQHSRELDEITIEVLRRTVEELTGRITSDNRRAVLMVVDSYTKRITRLKQRIGAIDPEGYLRLQIDALNWEKDYVIDRIDSIRQQASADGSHAEEHAETEACERMLDHIMNSLRHVDAERHSRKTLWRIKGRVRATQRQITTLLRRAGSKIRHTTPLFSEDEIFACTRRIQVDAIEHVISRLYEEMRHSTYDTEYCSALLLDYRRAEAALRSRPDMGVSAAAIAQANDVKRESYVIELGIIQDMFESGDINRMQAKRLRRNVYVMSVDADASM